MVSKKDLKVGKCFKGKDKKGETLKGKFTGHIHHFGDDREFPEIVETNGARHYILKTNLKKC